MKDEPSLEELGLDEPAKISSKISIERLQRESEYEVAATRPASVSIRPERTLAMDIGSLLLSIVLPGAGHALKGHWIAGLCWFGFVAGSYFLFLWIGIALHIFCIAAATIAKTDD